MKNINIATINYAITHSTIFHADDVFGVALLRTIRPDLQIIRTCRPTEQQLADLATEKAVVFDLGCQFGYPEYDHHQPEKALRTDGNPYCGFGLLWRDLGHMLCPNDKAWAKVDRDLVFPIDLADNGVAPSTLSAAIGSFNPTWEEGREAEEAAFWQAEAFAENVLRRYVEAANAEAKAEELVLTSRTENNGKVLVLDQYLPWQDTVIEKMPEILFVVYPSARGGYNIQTVPDAPGSFNGRIGFPEKWLGNPDASLGMTFCHVGNFLAAVGTLDNAINVANIAIELAEKESAAKFLINGFKRGNALTSVGNIHLLVEYEEYIFIWADGDVQKKCIGSYEDAPGCPIINEDDVREFVDAKYRKGVIFIR